MSHIRDQIDVEVQPSVAYDQWLDFASYPRFMRGVERVLRLDARILDWTATIAGRTKHWRAEIVDQVPGELVAWRSLEGPRNDATVRFEPLPEGTRVTLELDVEPVGTIEATGDALGFVARRAAGDLERFRDLVESRRPEGDAEVGSQRAGA